MAVFAAELSVEFENPDAVSLLVRTLEELDSAVTAVDEFRKRLRLAKPVSKRAPLAKHFVAEMCRADNAIRGIRAQPGEPPAWPSRSRRGEFAHFLAAGWTDLRFELP